MVPRFLLDAYQVILSIVGSIIVTAIVNPIFLVPVACTGIMFIFVRLSYLKTSKSVKRLEGGGTYKCPQKIAWNISQWQNIHSSHQLQPSRRFSHIWRPRWTACRQFVHSTLNASLRKNSTHTRTRTPQHGLRSSQLHRLLALRSI